MVTVSAAGVYEIKDGTVIEQTEAFSASASVNETTSQLIQVADSVTDQTINLGPVATSEVFMLETDQTITIKLNGSSDAITVDSVFVLGGTVTALTVSNASGSTANLTVKAGGT